MSQNIEAINAVRDLSYENFSTLIGIDDSALCETAKSSLLKFLEYLEKNNIAALSWEYAWTLFSRTKEYINLLKLRRYDTITPWLFNHDIGVVPSINSKSKSPQYFCTYGSHVWIIVYGFNSWEAYEFIGGKRKNIPDIASSSLHVAVNELGRYADSHYDRCWASQDTCWNRYAYDSKRFDSYGVIDYKRVFSWIDLYKNNPWIPSASLLYENIFPLSCFSELEDFFMSNYWPAGTGVFIPGTDVCFINTDDHGDSWDIIQRGVIVGTIMTKHHVSYTNRNELSFLFRRLLSQTPSNNQKFFNRIVYGLQLRDEAASGY